MGGAQGAAGSSAGLGGPAGNVQLDREVLRKMLQVRAGSEGPCSCLFSYCWGVGRVVKVEQVTGCGAAAALLLLLLSLVSLLMLLLHLLLMLTLLSRAAAPQVREMLLLRQLSQTMRQASAAGGFFDAWMKHNSDLVQGAANAFAGTLAKCKH